MSGSQPEVAALSKDPSEIGFYANGKRIQNLAKAFDLTLSSSLRPLLDSQIIEKIFSPLVSNPQERADLALDCYNGCRYRIEAQLEIMLEDNVIEQLNRLDHVLNSWQGKPDILLLEEEDESTKIKDRDQLTVEKERTIRFLKKCKKEEYELKEKLMIQKNRISELTKILQNKRREIDARMEKTQQVIEEFDQSDLKNWWLNLDS